MDERQINKLLPHKITFEKTYLISGGTYQQILFLDMPKTDRPTPFWLGELSQRKDINMAFEIIENNSTFRQDISETVSNLNRNISEEADKKKADSYKISTLNNRLEKAKILLEKITKERQKFFSIRLYIQVFASSESSLERKTRAVISAFGRKAMILSVASYLQ